MKQCYKCKLFKDPINFHKDPLKKDGLKIYCKECRKTEHKNRKIIYTEEMKIKGKEYRLKNKEKISKNRKKYRENNKEKLNKYYSKWKRNRIKFDENFKLICLLRVRLNSVLKNSKKSKTLEYLGCTVEELKLHIENQFKFGMTWKNHSKFGWHIDHIIPLSKFDLTKEEEIHKAMHYTNLQPLWWQENIKKGNKSN